MTPPDDPRVALLARHGIEGDDAFSQLRLIDEGLSQHRLEIRDLASFPSEENTQSRVSRLAALFGNDAVRAALVLLSEEKRRQEHDDPA